MSEHLDRFESQAGQYEFPYHWLPQEDPLPLPGRFLWWPYEYIAILSTVRELCLGLQPRKVLEVGCGDGRLAHDLLSSGIDEYIGLDLVEPALLFARAFNYAYRDRAAFLNVRAEDLEVGSFDLAVAMETFEHIPDQEIKPLVAALSDRLNPGGHLVVSVPTTNVPLHHKHERHYDLNLLHEHFDDEFELVGSRFVHRLGNETEFIRRLVVNKLFMTLHPAVVRWSFRRYERDCMHCDENTGAHVVTLWSRRASS